MVQMINLPGLQAPRNSYLDFSQPIDALGRYRQGAIEQLQSQNLQHAGQLGPEEGSRFLFQAGMPREAMAYGMFPGQQNALLAQTEATRAQTELHRTQMERLRTEMEFVNQFRDALMGRGTGGETSAPTSGTIGTGSGASPDMLAALNASRAVYTGGQPNQPNALLPQAPTPAAMAPSRPPLAISGQEREPGYLAVPSSTYAQPLPAPLDAPRAPVAPSRAPTIAPSAASPAGALAPIAAAALTPEVLARARQATPAAEVPGIGVTATTPVEGLNIAPAAPATAATPARAGNTLRDIFGRMSPEVRAAAYLYAIKGDYGELAKLIQGQTAGSEAVDRAYAPEYANWTAAGGIADVQRQMAQLMGVERALGSNASLTGPIVGRLPDWVNSVFNPQAVANRDRVFEVVQRSLRQVLGPQFTENEARMLMQRAYDPTQPQEENLRRVRALLTQIAAAATARQDAAEHFRQFGTLRGWQGRMPALSDFTSLFDTPTAAAPAPVTATEGGRTYVQRNGQWYPAN